MKPKILNKIKSDNYLMILYTFIGGKDVTFFNIYTNSFTKEHEEVLTDILNNVKNSGFKCIDVGKEKINFSDGKKFKYDIRFILYSKDVRKVYDKIKDLFEYENI